MAFISGTTELNVLVLRTTAEAALITVCDKDLEFSHIEPDEEYWIPRKAFVSDYWEEVVDAEGITSAAITVEIKNWILAQKGII